MCLTLGKPWCHSNYLFSVGQFTTRAILSRFTLNLRQCYFFANSYHTRPRALQYIGVDCGSSYQRKNNSVVTFCALNFIKTRILSGFFILFFIPNRPIELWFIKWTYFFRHLSKQQFLCMYVTNALMAYRKDRQFV